MAACRDPTGEVLYRLAAFTGLRAAEIASLARESFDFAADPPTVTVEAGYSKRRREDTLPLHPRLAETLKHWLAYSADLSEPLFPGNWYKRAADMLRVDLEAAGIAYETE